MLFKIPLVRRLPIGFYRWLARNRYRIGCGSTARRVNAILTRGRQGALFARLLRNEREHRY